MENEKDEEEQEPGRVYSIEVANIVWRSLDSIVGVEVDGERQPEGMSCQ